MSSEKLLIKLKMTRWEGKTQTAIAAETGIPQDQLSRIMIGNRNFGILNIVKLRNAYKDDPELLAAIEQYMDEFALSKV